MLQIPPRLLSRYEVILEEKNVVVSHREHYKKWLRFFLDFCSKYKFPANEASSISSFDQKLAEKNQAPWQRQQAKKARLNMDSGQVPGARTGRGEHGTLCALS